MAVFEIIAKKEKNPEVIMLTLWIDVNKFEVFLLVIVATFLTTQKTAIDWILGTLAR